MESTVYDYVIIGAGAAGLHLAMAFAADPDFKSRRLLIIEKDPERNNYPTWCFWEKGTGKWDDIVSKSWKKTVFTGNNSRNMELDLGAYTYKMVRGQDFIQYAKKKLTETDQVTWARGEVTHITQGKPNEIETRRKEVYQARHIFDGRIDPEYFKEAGSYSYLKQHFEGWVIETEQDVFDPAVFTMMDYSLVYPGTTSFTYILPFEANKALVEYTFFSPHLVANEVYETCLKAYIKKNLQVDDYEIVSKESGVIPMSDYPFHRHNNEFVTKIGTAGGWVKGSTGYSFKNAERKSQRILENIRKGKVPGLGLTRRRFRFYDTLFLDVLYNHNEIGPSLFDTMYQKNNIETIFSFLDEETTFSKEVAVMNTFDKWLFFKTILKQLIRFE